MISRVERFIPVGSVSLSSDAPGWNYSSSSKSGNKSDNNSNTSGKNGEKIGADNERQQFLQHATAGPNCWKCKGIGIVVKKVKNQRLKKKQSSISYKKSDTNTSPLGNNMSTTGISKISRCTKEKTDNNCPVCDGNGTIPRRKENVSSSEKGRIITRKRKCPENWSTSGPIADAVKRCEHFIKTYDDIDDCDVEIRNNQPLYLLHLGNQDHSVGEEKGAGISVTSYVAKTRPESQPPPSWLPINTGEQLCNLVGTWRIVQKVGSHRWTTDDLVTAYIAKREILKRISFNASDNELAPKLNVKKKKLRYLDLGCGNGSVLQMVCWSLIQKVTLKAFGVEARSEAVGLARRSLTFNIGSSLSAERGSEETSDIVSIIHGDFRELEKEQKSSCFYDGICKEQRNIFFSEVKCKKFDLISGTPPYFRVDFDMKKGTKNSGAASCSDSVTSAVINQGGMPTAVQSAPARCEFRGGIEAYCIAASKVLSDNGIFVVCVNSLNRSRVFLGAKEAELLILQMHPVKGMETRPQCLFDVYVMGKRTTNKNESMITSEILSVRTAEGKWTSNYADILEDMSIPARHNAA